MFKEKSSTPRPSEHPPVMREKISSFTWGISKEEHERVAQQLEKERCTIAGRPGSSEVHRHPLTRWDVSSIPANGIFLT